MTQFKRIMTNKNIIWFWLMVCAMIVPTAYADNQMNDLELTEKQTQAIEFLTQASVDVLDMSDVFKLAKSEDQRRHKKNKLSSEKKQCIYGVAENTHNYYLYQKDLVTRYVIANSPQKVQQDMAALKPQVINFFGQLYDQGIKNVTSRKKIHRQEQENKVESILKSMDVESIMLIRQIMKEDSYSQLRSLLNLDGISKSKSDKKLLDVEGYTLWAINQCDVNLSESNE